MIFASFNKSKTIPEMLNEVTLYIHMFWAFLNFRTRTVNPYCLERVQMDQTTVPCWTPSWSPRIFSSPLIWASTWNVRVYSLATTFKTRCISITFVNKLELLVIGCWLSHMKNPTVLRNGESKRTWRSYFSSPLHGNRDERSGRQRPVNSTYDWQFLINQVLTLRRMYK